MQKCSSVAPCCGTQALDRDFKEIGEACIPEDINRGKVDSVPGGMVLMVTKIRNLSAPKVRTSRTG